MEMVKDEKFPKKINFPFPSKKSGHKKYRKESTKDKEFKN